jgi:hypothetical protein
MAKYNEQLQRIWRQFEEENGDIPVTTREAVAWGVKMGLIVAPEADPLAQLAEDMARALREEYRTDKYGRKYRVNHAVRKSKAGVQYTFWGRMDAQPRPFMEMSYGQRRKGIIGDCFQLKTDVDVYNDKNPQNEPIPLVLDFTADVEEEQTIRRKGKGNAA